VVKQTETDALRCRLDKDFLEFLNPSGVIQFELETIRKKYEALTGKTFRPESFRHAALNGRIIFELAHNYGSLNCFKEAVMKEAPHSHEYAYAAWLYGFITAEQLERVPVRFSKNKLKEPNQRKKKRS